MSAVESFFDTNILLYVLSSDAKKADRVEELLEIGGVVSVQVLNEIASIALRKLALSLPEVRELLATVKAACIVRPIDVTTHENALDIVERHRFSVYDSLIVAAALDAGCTALYSEDLQHGQRIGRLKILNPFI